jgi:hypothetical protein
MDEKFRILTALGAGDFRHLDGSLIDHLISTRDILKSWSGSESLLDAGLYHAAYGTAGFSENLVNTDHRKKIVSVIGEQAEEIVYQYCACDRDYFWPKLGNENNPIFRNRFTGQNYTLPLDMLRNFCELTAANEIEVAINNPKFVAEHGTFLNKLFISMEEYLSIPARIMSNNTFPH